MKTVGLISGGKDSCFNMMCCIAEGHDVVALANLRPKQNAKDELDSYMFQTVGHHAVDLQAEAMGLPLYVQAIQGASLATNRDYVPCPGDEVEDLFVLLSKVKASQDIEAVSVGAILSDYQRVRVENVCQRLGLQCLSFLWRRPQQQLLQDMLNCGVKAIIIKVAALGLDPNKHLGLELADIYPHMIKMKSLYGLNECGEGGEYESFVFDCPIFKKTIVIDTIEKVLHSDDAFAPVGYLNLRNCHLEDKPIVQQSLQSILLDLPLLTSQKWVHDLESDVDDMNDIGKFDFVGNLKGNSAEKNHNTECQSLSGEGYVTSATDGVNFQVSGVTGKQDLGSDIKEVTGSAMDLMMAKIESLGHSPGEVTAVSLYVCDLADFAAINSVYVTYFNMNPPVRLCIQAVLPASCPLMLDCQGCRVESTIRKTMHVQALSHWCPANIGPYSQATQTRDKLFLAGIVPLIPATLAVVPGGPEVQCQVAFKHVQSVLAAMQHELTLRCCPLIVCFLTKDCPIPTASKYYSHALAKTSEDTVSGRPQLQVCVVPALPRGCVVEVQVHAWMPLHPGEGGGDEWEDQPIKEMKLTQKSSKWFLSTRCVCRKGETEMFSCHITVHSVHEFPYSMLPHSDVSMMVGDLLKQQRTALTEVTSAPDSCLAKIFFVATLFNYDDLHACVQQALADQCPATDRQVVSLVPVLSLASPCQVLAWCQ